MSRFPLGQPVRVSITVRDVTGALVNPGALTVVVKLAQADGTQAITGTYGSPANDGLGLFHQDVPAADLTVLGHYQWAATATGAGAGVVWGDFDVFDPFEQAVLPLQDAKDMLNIPQATTIYDAELLSWIATIETSLEGITGGPLANRSVTERAELVDGETAILVRQRPLVSVTSIIAVASGLPIDISAGLDIDANSGVVRRQLGWPFYGPFFEWLPAMLITYVAGWGTQVPATFNTVGRIILQHLWTTQHGPSARPSMGGAASEAVMIPGFPFAIPNGAAELLNGSLNGMPFKNEAFV